MRHVYSSFSRLVDKRSKAQVSQSKNQMITSDNLLSTRVSGYRGLHVHQMYKRSGIGIGLYRIGSPSGSESNKAGP